MKTGKKILSAVLTLMMVMSLMAALPVSADGVTITPSFTDGATIPLVGNITFTFGEGMDDTTINSANVIFKEDNLVTTSDDTDYLARKCNMSYDDINNVLTITFAEGDLAPGVKYAVEFTEAVLTDAQVAVTPVTYTFVTAKNGYYINDTFSRYNAVTHNSGSNSNQGPWQGYVNYTDRWGITDDGAIFIKQAAGAARTAKASYRSQYIPSDLAMIATATSTSKITLETEIEFKLEGEDSMTVRFDDAGGYGFVIKKDTKGTDDTTDDAGLALYAYSTSSWSELRLAPVSLNTTYKLHYVFDAWKSGSNQYMAYKKIELTQGSTEVYASTNSFQSYRGSMASAKTGATSNTSWFCFDVTGVADSTADSQLKVYSFKHKPYVAPTPVITVPATTTDYPVSGNLTFTSSEKLLASTVTAAGAVTMTGPSGAVACTPSLSDDGKTITVAYSGLTPGASYSVALANTITSAENVAIAATPFNFTVAVPDVVTITPAVASGSTIDAATTLTFTFSETMKADTINATNIVLKEENKASIGNYLTCVLPTPVLAADKKTMTVTFPEGYLAPKGTYQIIFTTALVSEEGGALAEETTFTYTTNGNGYYINDSFDRYVKNSTKTQAHTPPLYYTEQAYGSYQIKNDNGDAALYLNASTGSTGRKMAVGYGSMFIPDDLTKYTVANSENLAIYAESEMTFKVSGAEDSTFTLGAEAFVIKDADKEDGELNYGLYVGSTKLCDVEPGVKYTLKYIGSYYSVEGHTVGTGSRMTYITSAVLSTEEAAGTELISTPLQLSTNSSVTPCYTYVDGTNRQYTIAKATASASSTATTLYLYNFKHKPFACVAPAIVEGAGALAGNTYSKTITITNNSGRPVSYYVALAAYNGDELVALSTNNVASAVNGQTATVTRTVTDENIAGCTYKLILLKSLDSLQPLQAAFEGNIQ